jgi:hypothetical protein
MSLRGDYVNQAPLGDVILIQFQHIYFPYIGSTHSFWFNSKIVPPVRDPATGIDYLYLHMGETVILSKGSGLFSRRYSVIYLGNGQVSISHAKCDNPDANDVQIFFISNDE